MITLRKLISNTPNPVRQRAKQVSVGESKAKLTQVQELNSFVYEGLTRVGAEDPKAYRVVIELYPTEVHPKVIEAVSFDLRAWVQCSCPYWKFNCEVAVSKFGSSEIKFAKKNPNTGTILPTITNPTMLAYLCKHLFAAVPHMMEEFKKVEREEKEKRSKIFNTIRV